MSLRAYDSTDMMVEASVCEGTAVASQLEQLFAHDRRVAYAHLHNAKQGCYSCLVRRAC